MSGETKYLLVMTGLALIGGYFVYVHLRRVPPDERAEIILLSLDRMLDR